MSFIPRLIEHNVRQVLSRGKSVLLLGARQTGKTTLIEQHIRPDISYTFARANIRQRYETNPALLEAELEEQIKSYTTPPIIFIDEVQKIPELLDEVHRLMEKDKLDFILDTLRHLRYV